MSENGGKTKKRGERKEKRAIMFGGKYSGREEKKIDKRNGRKGGEET